MTTKGGEAGETVKVGQVRGALLNRWRRGQCSRGGAATLMFAAHDTSRKPIAGYLLNALI